jgi:hypothetical protein
MTTIPEDILSSDGRRDWVMNPGAPGYDGPTPFKDGTVVDIIWGNGERSYGCRIKGQHALAGSNRFSPFSFNSMRGAAAIVAYRRRCGVTFPVSYINHVTRARTPVVKNYPNTRELISRTQDVVQDDALVPEHRDSLTMVAAEPWPDPEEPWSGYPEEELVQVYTAPAATESTDKKKFTEFPEFIV